MKFRLSAWYQELKRLKADAKGAPVIRKSLSGVDNGPCTLQEVVVSDWETGLYDKLYGRDELCALPRYHVLTPDGRLVVADCGELRFDRGGRAEALDDFIDRAMLAVQEVDTRLGVDYLDPADLLERGSKEEIEAFEALVDLR